MAKFMTLGNIVTNAKSALKANVNATDVIVGAVIAKVGSKFVGGYIRKAVSASKDAPMRPPDTDTVKQVIWDHAGEISQVGIGVGLLAAQKGNARGKGHFIGAVGSAAVDFVAKKTADMSLPESIAGYAKAAPALSADFVAIGGYLGTVERSRYGVVERQLSDDFNERQQDMAALGELSEAMDRVQDDPLYDG